MATKRKGRTFWLTRDGVASLLEAAGFGLKLWSHRSNCQLSDYRGAWRAVDDSVECEPILTAICTKEWNRTAEPSARLKPGGGPIKVRVTIEAED